MSTKQIRRTIQNDLSKNNYSVFTQVRKDIPTLEKNKPIIQEAFKMKEQNPSLQLLIYYQYRDGKDIIMKHVFSQQFQLVLRQRKEQGLGRPNNILFLAIFYLNAFTLKDITLKVISFNQKFIKENRKVVYRNLTIVPHYTIKNNEKAKVQLKGSKTMKQNVTKNVKQNSQRQQNQIKGVKKQLQRVTVSQKPLQVQQPLKKLLKQAQKPVPNKKLLLQSDSQNSQGQAKYKAQVFQKNWNPAQTNKMQIQNDGNYRQNAINTIHQKIQIQQTAEKLKSFIVQDQSGDQDDQDDQLFKKLNDNNNVNKIYHQKDVKTAVNSPEQDKVKVQPKFQPKKIESKFQDVPIAKVAKKQLSLNAYFGIK